MNESRHVWLLRLFPRAWRARYAAEFRELLAARPLGPRDLWDIARSAADARLRPQAWLLELTPAPASGPAQPRHGVPPPSARSRQLASRRFTRRAFLRNAVLGSLGVTAVGMAGGAVAFAWQNTTSPFGGEFVVPRDTIPAVGAAPYRDMVGKFYLINNPDGLLALYWKCPHLGCTVPWNAEEGQFHCPCHQSQYNRHGERVAGPAPRPMDLMAARYDPAGNVVVDTGAITTRHRFTPEQALPPRPPTSA
jgi:cytochrome b6-f complex iron-sulfur subunit